MSFAKALSLMHLAEMAAARHGGVSLDEIAAAFEVDHRTAQRMVRALESQFAEVEVMTRPDRRRAWKLRAPGIARMRAVDDAELAALEIGALAAERAGDDPAAASLRRLRDRLVAALPPASARRAETDAEALLEAQGFVARPGPRTRVAPGVSEAIMHALKGPFRLRIAYGADAGERLVEPHGLLIGPRRYLVARQPERGPEMRHFRLDRIARAEATDQGFSRAADFDIHAHAARAFGVFQSEEEFAEVVWRFAPRAAATAREFIFHPDQRLTDEPDGALTVRFRASGWTEMTWHLFQWGDAVEVLAPEGLRRMRSDPRPTASGVLP